MKTQPKRVCVVRHGYYPSDPRVFKEVRALVEAGYAVDVLCLRTPGAPSREQINGVQVYRIPQSHRRGSKLIYLIEYALSFVMMSVALFGLYCRRRYACIQVNTLPDGLVFITLLPKLLGAGILLDLHEPTPELMLTKYNGNVRKSMMQFQCLVERWAIAYAHQSITVNDTIRQRFIERGADPQRMSVVRNVPAEDFGKDAPARQPHDGLVIMTHGTVQPRYGQGVLLHALPLLREKFSSLRLIIAGGGRTLDALQELAAELNCTDLVTFTGQVSRDQIAELITQADIGVVPLMPGPFSNLCQPNKLFEYIALKTAVISSRLPAIEESFDDDCLRFFRAGDAADLADAIAELGRNAGRREALAEQAFVRYQALCWNKAKQDYVRIMNSLAERKSDAK